MNYSNMSCAPTPFRKMRKIHKSIKKEFNLFSHRDPIMINSYKLLVLFENFEAINNLIITEFKLKILYNMLNLKILFKHVDEYLF